MEMIYVAIEFQLHHTGIKTFLLSCGKALRIPFQLHHTGIKTGSTPATFFELYSISIAPYRN